MKVWLNAFTALCLIFLCVPLAAQEGKAVEHAFGEVKSVTQDGIVVNEYFEDMDDYGDVTYVFSPDVKFKNADSYKDIPVGANVEIDYISENGKKAASVITVEAEVEVEVEEEEGYIYIEE